MSPNDRRRFVAVACIAALAACATLQAEPATTQPAAEAAIARSVAPALVQVEYTLRHDGAEAPYGGTLGQRCPNCGQYHGAGIDSLLKEERPLETAGFLVGDGGTVIAVDPLVQPRFIESIRVRAGDQLVPATIDRVYTGKRAVALKLERPIAGVAPLAFDASVAGPYAAVVPGQFNGAWQYSVKPIGTTPAFRGGARRLVDVDQPSVIIGKDGTPITIGMAEALAGDDAWRAAPADWPGKTLAELDADLARLRAATATGLLRVHLSFRSPPSKPEDGGGRMSFRSSRRGNDGDENATERDVLGVLVGPRRLLVLADLGQEQTARLQRVTIHPASGPAVPATFVSSYKDVAALLVEPERSMDGAVVLADDADPRTLPDRMLLGAEVGINGEQRVEHCDRRWVDSIDVGWRRQLFPKLGSSGDRPLFLFDPQLRLVSLPLSRRDTTPDDYNTPDAQHFAASYLRPLIDNAAGLADAANVPLSEADQARTAWLGVELQAMTEELARMNKVSELTKDGETGALVTFVYPDSPAQALGIKPGAILLRLHVPGRPAPSEVKAEDEISSFGGRAFPWEQLGQLPEQYFERIPRPWPTPRTKLSEELSRVGFGNRAELEYVQDGKTTRAPVTVTQSPPDFDTAKRLDHKSSGLGLREMTYEQRRYFQMTSDAPGLIVATIAPGSRASRVGLKPYEYLTHVNGAEVRTIADFERAAATGGGELKLNVKRFVTGRAVTMKLDQPTTPPSTGPSTAPAASATKPWAVTMPATTRAAE